VAWKVVILFEPSFEFGSAMQKKRHKRVDYVRGLPDSIRQLGYQLSMHEPVPISQYNYRLGAYALEKNPDISLGSISRGYVCPRCKQKLMSKSDAFFCKKCGISFPALAKIPCLDNRYAIICSKFDSVLE